VKRAAAASVRRQVQLCIGKAGTHIGGLWRMAPAFDLNPFPDKQRESKTWLSEQDGPITDVHMLLARSAYFGLSKAQALAILKEVHTAVSSWRKVAMSSAVGLQAAELDDFATVFEHEQME
jgi:serine/threonine-protein kinase HipA